MNRLDYLKRYLWDSGWESEGLHWTHKRNGPDKMFLEAAAKNQLMFDENDGTFRLDRRFIEADKVRRNK